VALAAVGLFAIVACWVTERTSEIGVRMALGASRGGALRLFMGRAAVLTATGLTVGVGIAALTTRFLAAWLLDTSPLDRPAFSAAALIMGSVCLLAPI
jgi:putative ABC transport system permease protein